MITVKFVSAHFPWPWHRQTPLGDGVFEEVRFLFDPAAEDYDYTVIFEALPQGFSERVVSERTIFVAAEPPNVKRYRADFLAQFGTVLTADRQTTHPGAYFTQLGLPWHIGMPVGQPDRYGEAMSFTDLAALKPQKTKLASVICSNKVMTPEHRRRLDFVRTLQETFGDRIDVFGRGFNEITDKAEALLPYRYHIVLENSTIPDYWTEKIADAFLAGCFPIYWGCSNLDAYFSHDSFAVVDIERPEDALEIIGAVIGSQEDLQAKAALEESRDQVLRRHNLFALLELHVLRLAEQPDQSPPIGLRPETCSPPGGAEVRQLSWLERIHLFLQPSPRLTGAARLAHRAWRRLEPGGLDGLENRINRLRDSTRRFGRSFAELRRNMDPTYRAHRRWLRDRGNERLRYDYDLSATSVVVDVGGYRGDWSAVLARKFGPIIHVFEPVPAFAAGVADRFAGSAHVTVHPCGLSDKDEQVRFSLADEASGFYSEGGDCVEVSLRDADDVLADLDRVDLMKLNIEGGEYAVLGRLIETGKIADVRYLQVQFHLFSPKSRRLYRRIARSLSRTHRLMWRYPFVWESWERK